MNLKLLAPSTWNPVEAWKGLFHDSNTGASQALSDLFITVTVYLAGIFLLWSVWLTLRSIFRTLRYRKALHGVTIYANVRQKLQAESGLPLFRGFHHHLVEIPLLDGSDKTESRRSVDAA